MKVEFSTSRQFAKLLGAAFLLQAITSLISGLILKLALLVPGNIIESMVSIANNTLLMRAAILGEMITAVGVIFLGAVLFVALRKQNDTVALVAMGFYILEAALLADNGIAAFSLLRISQEYVTAHSAYLQTMGNLAHESMDFGEMLLMLPFCLGAVLFYYMFYRSGIVPRALSLWGLITVSVALIATLFAISGYKVPFFVYLPYVPFEFTIGVWLLVKGVNVEQWERRAADLKAFNP